MSLRDYICNNYGWKLLSLLLAMLTWFTIQRDQLTQKSTVSAGNTRAFPSLPVTIMTAATDTRGFKINPERVLVKVIGKEETLATLQPADIGVFVNLAGNQNVDRLRKVVQVHAPEGVIVVSVIPAQVDVEHLPTPEPATPP